jgi:hypothetical protein
MPAVGDRAGSPREGEIGRAQPASRGARGGRSELG